MYPHVIGLIVALVVDYKEADISRALLLLREAYRV